MQQAWRPRLTKLSLGSTSFSRAGRVPLNPPTPHGTGFWIKRTQLAGVGERVPTRGTPALALVCTPARRAHPCARPPTPGKSRGRRLRDRGVSVGCSSDWLCSRPFPRRGAPSTCPTLSCPRLGAGSRSGEGAQGRAQPWRSAPDPQRARG